MISKTICGKDPYTYRVKNYFGLKTVNVKYYKRLVTSYKLASKCSKAKADFEFARPFLRKVSLKTYLKLETALIELLKTIRPQDIPTATGKLRKRQLAIVDYMMELIALLEKQGLHPFVDGGTALGAVRHGGFIPWDDDVDLGLVGKEFEQAKEFLKKKFISVDPATLTLKGKTEILEQMFKKYPNQTFIVPAFTAFQLFRGTSLDDCVTCDLLPYDYYKQTTTVADYNKVAAQEKEIIKTPFITAKEVQERFKKLRAENDIFADDYSGKIREGIGNHGGILYELSDCFLEIEDVFPLKTISFEGRTVPCVANLDKFLYLIYGDYMKLPMSLGIPKHFAAIFGENV